MLAVRIILVALYPMLVVVRAANKLRGRDVLRLKRTTTASYWIERQPTPRPRGYFAGAPAAAKAPAIVGMLASVGRAIASWNRGGDARASRPMQPTEIPDEIYTLW